VYNNRMPKILKNVTGSAIPVADTGISIAANSSYTIPPQDYLLWAASTNITTPVTNGSIVVNDGVLDLTNANGIDLNRALDFLLYPDTAFNVRFLSSPERANSLTSKTVQEAIEEVKQSAISASQVKQAFEDFMFDAYAGNGGNDNQYAFIPTTNSGSSDIDGAISVVGNDYEGIHILNSLTSAVSRPMVEAFNRVNRIKVGAQTETFEIRARIETLADVSQKFTTRYGLMDINTAGLPANGIIFSYDPIYPVTAVSQVVTATPVTTSKLPTQTFTQTINGFNYSYVFTTTETVQLTTWTRANNTLYRVTINGINCNYTSDANATDPEIAVGIANAINTNVGATVTAATTGGTKPVIITGDIVGADFTWSTSANITSVDNTATPVASTIVSSLISLINADGALPVTASGTNTLVMTADVAGTPFTYAGTTNLTQVLTTPNVVQVLYSGNWIASVVNSSTVTNLNSGVSVVANQWYRLKAVINNTASAVTFYINDILIGTITTAVPSAAMHYVLKLEKTLGTVSRTTSIDYIYWIRDRN